MDEFIQSYIDIMLPVMESSLVLAGEYCKACGRKTLTGQDEIYAMKYAAMNVTGKQVGTLFPEIYEQEETDSDDEEIETVDEEDEPFTRYSGDNELMNSINSAYDSWASWEPQTPAERMLKSSIDKVHDL